MTQCIAKRWRELDREVYLAAYVLDPKMFDNGLKLNWFDISVFLPKIYKRVFQQDSATLS